MMRCKKPPILPVEYAFADASSMRRIASIWRYKGASSSVVVSTYSGGSSCSIRLLSGVVMDAVTTGRTIPAAGRARSIYRGLVAEVELDDAGRTDRLRLGKPVLFAELDERVAARQLVHEERAGLARDRRVHDRLLAGSAAAKADRKIFDG